MCQTGAAWMPIADSRHVPHNRNVLSQPCVQREVHAVKQTIKWLAGSCVSNTCIVERLAAHMGKESTLLFSGACCQHGMECQNSRQDIAADTAPQSYDISMRCSYACIHGCASYIMEKIGLSNCASSCRC